jgi:hypothetical protein
VAYSLSLFPQCLSAVGLFLAVFSGVFKLALKAPLRHLFPAHLAELGNERPQLALYRFDGATKPTRQPGIIIGQASIPGRRAPHLNEQPEIQSELGIR